MSIVRNDLQILAPGEDAFSITPSDADYFPKTRGLFVASATAVVVEMASGAVVTFNALAAGVVHPLQVVRVLSTGTTATGIIGIR
jgi:hypothetical protein